MSESKRSAIVSGVEVLCLRQNLGWSIDELARQSGLTRRTIQRAQGGHRLDFATIHAIAQALGVEYQQLVLDKEIRNPPKPAQPTTMVRMAFNVPYDAARLEADMECISNALRLITENHFKLMASKGRKGSLIVTIEMADEDIHDLDGIVGNALGHSIWFADSIDFEMTAYEFDHALMYHGDMEDE